jgi:hypothetical protein
MSRLFINIILICLPALTTYAQSNVITLDDIVKKHLNRNEKLQGNDTLYVSMLELQNNYKKYQSTYGVMAGINIKYPEDYVTELEEEMSFYFGLIDQSRVGMKYCSSLSVRIDEDCIVYLTNAPTSKLHYDETEPLRPYHPSCDDFLYQNIDVPYTHWYNYPNIRQVESKRKKALKKYLTYYDDPEMKKRLQADIVNSIQIPDFDRIFVEEPSLHNYLHAFFDSCYMLEFFNETRRFSVIMLLFIHQRKGGKTIDDYVEQISHYVRFDPDFKLE